MPSDTPDPPVFDRRMRFIGYAMIVVYVFMAVNAALSLLLWWYNDKIPWAFFIFTFMIAFGIYMLRVRYRLRWHEWWAMYFGYTVIVNIREHMEHFDFFSEDGDEKNAAVIADWLAYNIRGQYVHWVSQHWTIVKFRDKKDAALFKLWWG